MGAQQKIINDGNSFVALCSSFFARTHAKKKECDRIENRFRVFARTRIKKKKIVIACKETGSYQEPVLTGKRLKLRTKLRFFRS